MKFLELLDVYKNTDKYDIRLLQTTRNILDLVIKCFFKTVE